MAAPRILSLSRTLFSTTTNKQTLASFLLSRPFSSITSSSSMSSSVSNFNLSLLRLRPLASTVSIVRSPAVSSAAFRAFSSDQSQTSLSDNNPNWSNRPPKETILLDGCDFEHWLVVTEPPPENATRDEIIDSYIKTLAQIVGSEEEARMKIYSVSTKHYFAFGALVSEELSYKLKELPHVRWVLPDSYLDVKNKDYGGEPFINGQAVPYDPKYHEDWVRNNAKAQERNRRNDRPRNADRSRNFDRRQGREDYQNPGQGAANMGGPPRGNMGGPPNNSGGPPPNRPPNNPGYAQNPNAGYAQNPNAGYAQNPNAGYPQNPNAGYPQNPNAGYAQNPNAGYAPNAPPNPGFAQNQNRGMPPPNYTVQGNPGYQGPYPNTQMGGNQNYAQPNNMGGQPGGTYQPQDVPGRDGPNY